MIMIWKKKKEKRNNIFLTFMENHERKLIVEIKRSQKLGDLQRFQIANAKLEEFNLILGSYKRIVGDNMK